MPKCAANVAAVCTSDDAPGTLWSVGCVESKVACSFLPVGIRGEDADSSLLSL